MGTEVAVARERLTEREQQILDHLEQAQGLDVPLTEYAAASLEKIIHRRERSIAHDRPTSSSSRRRPADLIALSVCDPPRGRHRFAHRLGRALQSPTAGYAGSGCKPLHRTYRQWRKATGWRFLAFVFRRQDSH
jgi:hypothetical protein